MGWRVGAGWALVGFAAQCFLALGVGEELDVGLRRALVHYVAWGIAGFLVGTIVSYALEESIQNRVAREEEKKKEQEARRDEESAASNEGGS